MNIRIPWIWLTVGLFLAIELILLFKFSQLDESHRGVVLFGATIVGGAFALYSYLHRIQEHRFAEAGEMMQRWNAPERLTSRMVMADVTDGNFDLEKIRRRNPGQKFDEETHKLRIQILAVLNFYEELAIGIAEKSMDNDRCFRFFRSMAEQTWTSLSSWIQSERNVDRNQTYYCEFEALVMRWRKQANGN
jgi:hypothetical protein